MAFGTKLNLRRSVLALIVKCQSAHFKTIVQRVRNVFQNTHTEFIYIIFIYRPLCFQQGIDFSQNIHGFDQAKQECMVSQTSELRNNSSTYHKQFWLK